MHLSFYNVPEGQPDFIQHGRNGPHNGSRFRTHSPEDRRALREIRRDQPCKIGVTVVQYDLAERGIGSWYCFRLNSSMIWEQFALRLLMPFVSADILLG